MTISTTDKKDCLLFSDPNSKIGIGIYDNYFVNNIGTQTPIIPIPNDFFNGKPKHIVVTYNKDDTEFEMYVNGEKLEKSSSTDTWSGKGDSNAYIGKRERRRLLL